MCLDIKKTFHYKNPKARKGDLVAVSLDRPILVVKALQISEDYVMNEYTHKSDIVLTVRSPYRSYLWKFGEMFTADMSLEMDEGWSEIHRGLHACQTIKKFAERFDDYRGRIADMWAEGGRKSLRELHDQFGGSELPFPAIIPAGANVWFGTNDDDVASDKMQVYLNMDKLRRDYPSIGEPMKPKDLLAKHRVV